jgi:hypothetical protein
VGWGVAIGAGDTKRRRGGCRSEEGEWSVRYSKRESAAGGGGAIGGRELARGVGKRGVHVGVEDGEAGGSRCGGVVGSRIFVFVFP